MHAARQLQHTKRPPWAAFASLSGVHAGIEHAVHAVHGSLIAIFNFRINSTGSSRQSLAAYLRQPNAITTGGASADHPPNPPKKMAFKLANTIASSPGPRLRLGRDCANNYKPKIADRSGKRGERGDRVFEETKRRDNLIKIFTVQEIERSDRISF